MTWLLAGLLLVSGQGYAAAPRPASALTAAGAGGRSKPAANPVRGPNLLRNPSFEVLGSRDSTNPPGWNRWSEIGSAGQFVWDNQAGRATIGRSSQYALRVENTGDRGGWIAAEPVAIQENKLYLVCGFVSVHQSAGEVRYGVRFIGTPGLLGEYWTPAITGSTGAGGSDWIAVAEKFRPPEGAVLAQVVCRADFLTGPAWFDDIGLYELPDAVLPLPARDLPAAFQAKLQAADRAVSDLKNGGKFWQAAAVAAGQAKALWGVARQDEAAGWTRRSRDHEREALATLARSTAAARRGAVRSDPLAVTGTPAVFPAGVVLAYRGETPPAQVAAELELLAQFGLTDIQTDFPWGMWEPARGSYDFSMPDALLAMAAKSGSRIWAMSGPKYGQIGGRMKDSSTSLRGYTGWYLDQFPDAGLHSSSGESVRAVDGLFREFAFIDPRRLKVEPEWLAVWGRSVKALVAHAQGSPGLAGWLLSDAPRLGSGPDPSRKLLRAGLLGYNPEYLAAFRHWLQERYVTAAALRTAWGSDGLPTGKIEGAEPPGQEEIKAAMATPQHRYRGAQPWIADWLEFRATALAEGLGWQQRVMGTGVPVLPEVSVSGPLDPDGLAAELIAGATTGPIAMNLTPGASPFPLLTHAQDVALAAAGASGRPLWLTGYSFHVSGVLGGEERQNVFAAPYVAPYVWGAVLSGVRGFFFDGWTGRIGPGSLAYPGRRSTTALRPGAAGPGAIATLSDEGVAIAQTAAALRVAGPWLTGAMIAPPRYGILVSRAGLLFDDPEAHHPLAMLNALALAGVHEVPVVTERMLLDGAPPFEVLFAPYVTRLSPGAIEALKAFVSRGGVLIADSYLATREPTGAERRPLSDGLDDLFGVDIETAAAHWSEDGTIGSIPTPVLSELKAPLPVSLSWFAGGHRMRAGKDTEVLANFTGGAPGHELPSITVHIRGQGRAVLVPRVRLWPPQVEALRNARITRPELRALRLGRTSTDFNGLCWALTLRAVLQHLDRMPAVRLVRAPVATAYLDAQAAWHTSAGLSVSEKSVSRYLATTTQGPALPFVARTELIALAREFLVDLDTLAPVRVNLLQGSGGRMAVAVNGSSWGRDAELAVPANVAAAADLLTGEEWSVVSGRLRVALAPYQARLLALW